KLQDLDDELKEKYLELISRFYLLFENIYQYIVDLNLFLEQLNDNAFIQQNMETAMKDPCHHSSRICGKSSRKAEI
ncbi:WASH complex subunit strumpellin, partial [Operophtera brumata]